MQILLGSIPSIVMMYITGVLEEMVKDLWQDTFVPCICKFESMQPINIIPRDAPVGHRRGNNPVEYVFVFVIIPRDAPVGHRRGNNPVEYVFFSA